MNRRGLTFDDLWIVAVVSVVLAAGVLLCIGPPDVDLASRRADRAACVSPVGGGPACAKTIR